MTTEKTNRELVNDGFAFAKNLNGDTPVMEIAKMIAALATRLDVVTVRSNALAAENLTSRNAVQAFCDVVQSNTDAICEELGADNVRLILDAMRSTGNMPATDAILREVGARAVDLHSKDQREQIGNKRKNDAASAYASREAERFAALIRAGEVQP